MNTTTETPLAATSTPVEKDDPWRYGWRYVRREEADGKSQFEQVPLTKMDLLHPEEDHCFTYTQAHSTDCDYLWDALRAHLGKEENTLVLAKCRVDWSVQGLRPHAVDIVVFRHVKTWDRELVTFTVAALGARPALVIEITSPETAEFDLGVKVDHYRLAGVPFYAIVDQSLAPGGPIRLFGYCVSQSNPSRYDPVLLDSKGRLWLAPVKLWLAVENHRVVCYDEQENRFFR